MRQTENMWAFYEAVNGADFILRIVDRKAAGNLAAAIAEAGIAQDQLVLCVDKKVNLLSSSDEETLAEIGALLAESPVRGVSKIRRVCLDDVQALTKGEVVCIGDDEKESSLAVVGHFSSGGQKKFRLEALMDPLVFSNRFRTLAVMMTVGDDGIADPEALTVNQYSWGGGNLMVESHRIEGGEIDVAEFLACGGKTKEQWLEDATSDDPEGIAKRGDDLEDKIQRRAKRIHWLLCRTGDKAREAFGIQRRRQQQRREEPLGFNFADVLETAGVSVNRA